MNIKGNSNINHKYIIKKHNENLHKISIITQNDYPIYNIINIIK